MFVILDLQGISVNVSTFDYISNWNIQETRLIITKCYSFIPTQNHDIVLFKLTTSELCAEIIATPKLKLQILFHAKSNENCSKTPNCL